MSSFVIGIDLGGTNMRSAVLDNNHNLLARHEIDTNPEDGPEAVIDRMARSVSESLSISGLQKTRILAIGVGTPGPINVQTGVVTFSPNLKWENVPLVSMLEERTGIKVIMENDANAAGWGEYWAGAGRGCRNMVLMTLGTGVGGAIILNGHLITGPDWTAGEIGHVVVADGGRLCGCGARGCIEAYASATATVERFREALKFGWHSSIADKPANITCADIFAAAIEGDNLAHHIVAETGRYLGLMAANMANLLNPERCVFSGGMINAGDILFDAIKAECTKHAFEQPAKRMQILPAELGEDAGLIGAAGCALERLRQ